jgi:NADPH-dependent ferric siderophore reductase
MNHAIRVPIRVRHETRRRLLQVARVEQLSPRMRRIVLAGDELDGFTSAAADDHVKLFFPGGAAPIMRDYTPRWFDPARRELAIEFVIHGDGPATTWAAQAEPGQWLEVGGPRGSILTPDDYATTLLAGDETALPAIARHLAEMQPGARVLALIEVADPAEERHLPTAGNAIITWLHRNGAPAGTTPLLHQALRNLTLSSTDTYAWIAAEIETARTLRRHLIEERNFARDQIRAAGYWRLGEEGAHTTLSD